jgi:predicted dehydrogenase
MAPVDLGLIGAGRLAEAGYLPAAELDAGVRFVAVADPDEYRRADMAGGGRRIYDSAQAMLTHGGFDGVVVASPPAAHEHGARLAAAAGIPALVEKPPAPDLAGARRLAALDPAPFIGFNRRFALGEELRGRMPEAGSVELALRYRRFSWSPVMVRDPALLDLAPHLVDLALWAGVGDPERVAAGSSRAERLKLTIEGGRGRASIECASDRPHLERAVVRDRAGKVVARARAGGLFRGLAARARPGPHFLVASLAAQLREFAAVISGGSAPRLATAADGVAAMTVVAAAAESLALGGELVPVADSGVAAA